MTQTPSFFLGAAYVPSLTKALHAVQDADLALQGCGKHEGRVTAAMESHRTAVKLLRKFLSMLKVI